MIKATIKEVALEAEVSTATVSRVLNQIGFVSEEIKERVYVAVQKLNYQPNAIARSLKQDKTHTIGVVIPDISNSFFMLISRGLEDVVHKSGYNLFFCSSDENPQKEEQLLQLLFEKRVDAIVLATSGHNEAAIERLSHAGIPIILVDRRIDHQNLKLDLVAEDNFLGAYELTKQLLQRSHTAIGVINGSLEVSTGQDRYAGYLQAIREFGIEEQSQLVYNGQFSEGGGMNAVQHFLQLAKKPSAILSFNNKMTFGVLLQLTRLGFQIPEDMVIACYGEVEAALLLKDSGIIYVGQTPYEMGMKTGRIVLKRLEKREDQIEPQQEIFKPVVQQI